MLTKQLICKTRRPTLPARTGTEIAHTQNSIIVRRWFPAKARTGKIPGGKWWWGIGMYLDSGGEVSCSLGSATHQSIGERQSSLDEGFFLLVCSQGNALLHSLGQVQLCLYTYRPPHMTPTTCRAYPSFKIFTFQLKLHLTKHKQIIVRPYSRNRRIHCSL